MGIIFQYSRRPTEKMVHLRARRSSLGLAMAGIAAITLLYSPKGNRLYLTGPKAAIVAPKTAFTSRSRACSRVYISQPTSLLLRVPSHTFSKRLELLRCMVMTNGLNENMLEKVDKIQEELRDMDREYDEVVFKLQQDVETERKRLFGRRAAEVAKIPGFWQQALMNSPEVYSILGSRDLDALNYMTDLRVEYPPGDPGFILHFHFARDNPYFDNPTLLAHVIPNDQVLPPGYRRTKIMWTEGAEPLFIPNGGAGGSRFFEFFGERNRFPFAIARHVEALFEDPLAFYTDLAPLVPGITESYVAETVLDDDILEESMEDLESSPEISENSLKVDQDGTIEGEIVVNTDLYDEELNSAAMALDDCKGGGEDDVFMDEDGKYVDIYGNSLEADGGYVDANGIFVPYAEESEPDAEEEALLAMDEVVRIQDMLSDVREKFEYELLSEHRQFDVRRQALLTKRQAEITKIPDFWSNALMGHPILATAQETDGDDLRFIESIQFLHIAQRANSPIETLVFTTTPPSLPIRLHLTPNGAWIPEETLFGESQDVLGRESSESPGIPGLSEECRDLLEMEGEGLMMSWLRGEGEEDIGRALREVFAEPLVYYKLHQTQSVLSKAEELSVISNNSPPPDEPKPWDTPGFLEKETGVQETSETLTIKTDIASYKFDVLITRPNDVLQNATTRRLVFLHGFLGDNIDWQPVMSKLSSRAVPPAPEEDPPPTVSPDGTEDPGTKQEREQRWKEWADRQKEGGLYQFECISVSLPNHGGSTVSNPKGLTIPNMAEALGKVMSHYGCTGSTLIGYSMGGRLALYMGLRLPYTIGQVVVVSSSPGIEARSDRDERRLKDEILARDLREKGLRRFLDDWYSQPLFEKLKTSDDFEAILARRQAGDAVKLSEALEYGTVGRMPSLWDELRHTDTRMLFIVGSEDKKFIKIARDMRKRVREGRRDESKESVDGRVQIAITQGSGHAPHVEAPDSVTGSVKNFDLIVGRRKGISILKSEEKFQSKSQSNPLNTKKPVATLSSKSKPKPDRAAKRGSKSRSGQKSGRGRKRNQGSSKKQTFWS